MDATVAPQSSGQVTSKGGLATLIAGICIIVGGIGSEFLEPLWFVVVIGFALLLYAMPKLHAHQAPADGAAGLWGSRLVVFGGSLLVLLAILYLVWEAVGDAPDEAPGPINALWPIGFFSFLVGIVLFSVASVRAKVFPSGAPILMLVGLVGGVGLDMATGVFFEDDPETTAWGALIGLPLFGLGLAWIGNSLWKGQAGTSTPASSVET